jgi:hypothetical protein
MGPTILQWIDGPQISWLRFCPVSCSSLCLQILKSCLKVKSSVTEIYGRDGAFTAGTNQILLGFSCNHAANVFIHLLQGPNWIALPNIPHWKQHFNHSPVTQLWLQSQHMYANRIHINAVPSPWNAHWPIYCSLSTSILYFLFLVLPQSKLTCCTHPP